MHGSMCNGSADGGGERVQEIPAVGADDGKPVRGGLGKAQCERRSRCADVLARLVCGIGGQADRLGESHSRGHDGY